MLHPADAEQRGLGLKTPPLPLVLLSDSDDIDVALDNISGAAFAEAVNEYLTEQGMETHRIGVIEVRDDILDRPGS